MTQREANRCVEIRIRGLVQGVGFRPSVWRIANELALIGDVSNDEDGVLIRCAGQPGLIDTFVRRLRSEVPLHARIDSVSIVPMAAGLAGTSFRIVESTLHGAASAVVPDMATCAECYAEVVDPGQRRYRYPFTNCTHCGPRLTIMDRAPYDRHNTSMRTFSMCEHCASEYTNPADRRFHAQPIACPQCGPHLRLRRIDGSILCCVSGEDPIAAAAKLIKKGDIVAIKGLGGFHLACDATNNDAVMRLRSRKQRFSKAFAVMMRDLEAVKHYCAPGDLEVELLRSATAPIVLLEATGSSRLPEAIAPGLRTLGVVLPYTPLHHMMLSYFDYPLVMTSANTSDEPQCTDNEEARERLAAIADHILDHGREIFNRLDDSVVCVAAGRPTVLRRARGYAPTQLRLPEGFVEAPPIIAMGGELKSTFCLLDGNKASLSQHLGDLENAPTFDDYRKTLDLYRRLFEHKAEIYAVDLHPEYLSRKLGESMAQTEGVRLVEIQHHHAHIAACLAENGVPIDAPPVLGIALDGLGLAPDGAIWGGEFLLADYRGYRRLASFRPIAMPGAAAAIREPWRNTVAQLHAAMPWAEFEERAVHTRLHAYLMTKPIAAIASMIESGVNSPRASSAGRLFDAVAGTLGVTADLQNHEGEAAACLEALAKQADEADQVAYTFEQTVADDGLRLIETAALWRRILADLCSGVPATIISARFHRGLARCIADVAEAVLNDEGIQRPHTVALSGGCFQNRLLLQGTKARLEANSIKVLTHAIVPANDGGLALGQAAITAACWIADRSR